jgi:hypothetical protein
VIKALKSAVFSTPMKRTQNVLKPSSQTSVSAKIFLHEEKTKFMVKLWLLIYATLFLPYFTTKQRQA